jgi:phage tail P2-like protein
MNLSNIDLIKLQTNFMKQDTTTQALCSVLTPQFQQISDEIKACLIYSRVDELPEKVLDELAWQMHVDFYDVMPDIQKKRELVKKSIIIHRTKGTPYAVEQLIKVLFNDGYVEEWWEYGSSPYMFRVVIVNPETASDISDKFIRALESVKNVRSFLEDIVINYMSKLYMNIKFLKYDSEPMKYCGSLKTTNIEYRSTEGRRYSDIFKDKLNKYFSNIFAYANQSIYPNGSNGKRFMELVKDIKRTYFSNKFMVAAENIYPSLTDGKSNGEIIKDTKKYYFSNTFQLASASSYCRGGV